ncbi:MAG TPA: hypothetical protein VII98_15550 [Solirubrobacteraceae bacterium]
MTALTTLAQYRMDYVDHMDGGWGWGMMALIIITVLAVVALVIWLVRANGLTRSTAVGGAPAETPMQILDRRLAQGEIAPEEYKDRAAILGGH